MIYWLVEFLNKLLQIIKCYVAFPGPIESLEKLHMRDFMGHHVVKELKFCLLLHIIVLHKFDQVLACQLISEIGSIELNSREILIKVSVQGVIR